MKTEMEELVVAQGKIVVEETKAVLKELRLAKVVVEIARELYGPVEEGECCDETNEADDLTCDLCRFEQALKAYDKGQ